MPRAQVVVVDKQPPPPLAGWMLKKHKHKGGVFSSSWGKRWVHINDERGRLHIGKQKGKEGTTVVRSVTRC